MPPLDPSLGEAQAALQALKMQTSIAFLLCSFKMVMEAFQHFLPSHPRLILLPVGIFVMYLVT